MDSTQGTIFMNKDTTKKDSNDAETPSESDKPATNESSDERAAAKVIQRNYRGHRERRKLRGMGLDPSTRWFEAIKEAQYRDATRPISRRKRTSMRAQQAEQALQVGSTEQPEQSGEAPQSLHSPSHRRQSSAARDAWKRVGIVARRAGENDTSDSVSDEDKSLTEEQRKARYEQKMKAKREREKTAKMMDLQYFLEMVDHKHRYGSNLRAYHEEWKKSDTHENFFYWLDRGEGKHIELPTVSRERLEREQIRYLSREERQKYLVKIDDEGRLRWAKNGQRISTNLEWKDSIDGIVPRDDNTTPTFRDPTESIEQHKARAASMTSSSDSSLSTDSEDEAEAAHYVNHELRQAKGLNKIKHVSAATILNHLLRRSVKPNSWLFVADTSFRLYIGIKQSGAFQHSSFLHGSRISAAGLIKVKDGQLRRLSPLSGHYRPPTENFRAFVHALKDAGVDMSRVSISRSYAVLVGLEMYTRTRKKLKHGAEHASEQKEKAFHPEEARKREKEKEDNSKSAQKERDIIEEKMQIEEEVKRDQSLRHKFMRKLGFRSNPSSEAKKDVDSPGRRRILKRLNAPGQGAEDAIPPDGKRESI